MSEPAPRVSVVVPTYNRRRLVVEALESVRRQTFTDYEALVIDDGSTDGTAQTIATMEGLDQRFTLVCQPNGGTASARNRAIDAARAPFLAFLDSDDLWHPRYLERQVAALEADPLAHAVLCDADYVGHEPRRGDHLFGDGDFKAPVSGAAMCQGAWALPTAMVMHTPVARALRFSQAYRFSEDTEFLFRFHEAGYRLILNPERLAVWRRHQGESGAAPKTSDFAAFEREALRMLKRYRHLAGDDATWKRNLQGRHRQVAKALVANQRWADARPHLLVWWRSRPWRPRPALLYLRSLLARSTGP